MSEFYTLVEVATILKCSPDTVARKFAKLPGVVDMGTPENLKKHKRRYRVFRIPRAVLEKYLTEKAGHPVTVSSITLGTKRKKKGDPWEETVAQRLAAMVADNSGEATSRKTFERIARNAGTLSLVPRDEWAAVVFLEDTDE